MFGAYLVVLAPIYDELLRGQAEFPRILRQNDQNDLEGQGQLPLFSIPTESIPWYMFGANLVIPAQICDELSSGQGKVYRQTDGQMDGRRQWQYPFRLKGQGVKNLWRSPGSVWFTNCMHSKCHFLVRKVCHANYRGMVSSVLVEM